MEYAGITKGMTILGMFVGILFAMITTGLDPTYIFIEGLAGALLGLALGVVIDAAT